MDDMVDEAIRFSKEQFTEERIEAGRSLASLITFQGLLLRSKMQVLWRHLLEKRSGWLHMFLFSFLLDIIVEDVIPIVCDFFSWPGIFKVQYSY